jgi:hypothetical protein
LLKFNLQLRLQNDSKTRYNKFFWK